jgi:hypothetical protein
MGLFLKFPSEVARGNRMGSFFKSPWGTLAEALHGANFQVFTPRPLHGVVPRALRLSPGLRAYRV